VGDLVGMALADRLRGEDICVHNTPKKSPRRSRAVRDLDRYAGRRPARAVHQVVEITARTTHKYGSVGQRSQTAPAADIVRLSPVAKGRPPEGGPYLANRLNAGSRLLLRALDRARDAFRRTVERLDLQVRRRVLVGAAGERLLEE